MELHKTRLIELFHARNITASKTLGQNFLLDGNFLDFILRTAELTPDDLVLEIGSGPGILTHLLAEKAKYVWAVEIDHNLFSIAQELYGATQNIKFIRCNFLAKDRYEINPEVLAAIDELQPKSIKVISNLPYKTAVPIIMTLLESRLPISTMLLMVQLEIAQRLTALPGAHNYSSVSILCQFLSTGKKIKKVPPDVFWPKPEVFSSLMTLTPHHRYSREYMRYEYLAFKRFLKLVFSYRRKVISRALQNAYARIGVPLGVKQIEEILARAKIDSSLRPQKILPEQYLNLFNQFQTDVCDLTKTLDLSEPQDGSKPDGEEEDI